ncbi:hypothetical protein FB45DRAFT_26700 [Roridomyces roridus]|uniref:Uncharacterized protein n=1 Tax=Roridomyces roridus TaxID=1738132 RepID=A0AAD7CK39_9AGAR|nr:hypothetical protein FB45DRAFT_26700 [Roridomyces roridus]
MAVTVGYSKQAHLKHVVGCPRFQRRSHFILIRCVVTLGSSQGSKCDSKSRSFGFHAYSRCTEPAKSAEVQIREVRALRVGYIWQDSTDWPVPHFALLSTLVRVVFANFELVHAILLLRAPGDNPSFRTKWLCLHTFIFAAQSANMSFHSGSPGYLHRATFTQSGSTL